MKYQAPKGTRDILQGESSLYRYIEKTAREVFSLYGYDEIITPTFESYEVFSRSIGDSTDIVEKEMYVFYDRKGRKLALRPEGTAGTIRAVIENSLFKKKSIIKLFYIQNMFRYEQPQKGRFREFFQIGAELIGLASPSADTEIIMLNLDILQKLGLKDAKLYLNSIGCKDCKQKYKKILLDSINIENYCTDCKRRFKKNPLRILDCKQDKEKKENLPTIDSILCEDCQKHFQTLLKYLNELKIDFQIDPFLVRGIDYYTRTIFEIKYQQLGSQDAISAGGRYDNLINELGGPKIPAVGFAIGTDRISLILAPKNILPTSPRVSISITDESKTLYALELSKKIRAAGIPTIGIFPEKSLKAQLRISDNLKCNYTIIIGDEIQHNKLVVRDMRESKQELIDSSLIVDYLNQKLSKNLQ